MKYALVTIHDQNYQELADITWTHNKLLYAEKWGYETIAKTDDFSPIPIGYEKIKLLIEILNRKEHDVLFWSGTDTVITNFHISLDMYLYPDKDVTVSPDFNFIIISDSIVIRNTEKSRSYFQMLMDTMPKYIDNPMFENQAMVDTYEEWKDVVKVIPQKFLNAYTQHTYDCHKTNSRFNWPATITTVSFEQHEPNSIDKLGVYGKWTPGDFLMHAPGIGLVDKLAAAQKVMSLVLK